ncbi:MAG: tRNA (adenosine(37)-N6)-dimethylallyltransferase MiaA, partial [Nitrospiria bacterium]
MRSFGTDPKAAARSGAPVSVKRPWFLIVGPTAVGKSRVAEILAEGLHTEIIVADSRQIYLEMDIGTAKPSLEARGRVPRHLIDLISSDQPFSAGAYKRIAEEKIAEMEKEGKAILIEGGTGLYIKTLLYGLWAGPPADWRLRKALLEKEKEEGEGTLYHMLEEIDPASSGKMHLRDLPKIVRALEVNRLTGRPLSEFHTEHRRNR